MHSFKEEINLESPEKVASRTSHISFQVFPRLIVLSIYSSVMGVYSSSDFYGCILILKDYIIAKINISNLHFPRNYITYDTL